MFLNICSSDIADHIIDADIYDEAFAYFVDEVEIIIQVLEEDATPIEYFFSESGEEEKLNKLKIVLKEATRIYIQGHECSDDLNQLCPTPKKCARDGLLTWWIGKINN